MKQLLSNILLCLSSLSFAQQAQITGTTTEAGNDMPLPYVNIGIRDTPVGTVSGSNGTFTLKLPEKCSPDDRVTFSYIGYETQEHKVSSLSGKNNRITLSPKPNRWVR